MKELDIIISNLTNQGYSCCMVSDGKGYEENQRRHRMRLNGSRGPIYSIDHGGARYPTFYISARDAAFALGSFGVYAKRISWSNVESVVAEAFDEKAARRRAIGTALR